ncbi:MAG: alpha/beta hydrolase [Ktedonobacterales bacterium]|nr:alpha/beta hydrolase [Ktedonobacterales bacterium]
MAMIDAVDIPTTHGMLEGLLRHEGYTSLVGMAAVVCHPHPLGGGTMHNKVVFTLAKTLGEAGIPALRFNFRGVGRSTGAFDEGRGEADDVRVALDWLAARYPATPLLLAGFSFGAWVGLPVGCGDPRVTRIIGAGVPTSLLDVAALTYCAKPKLIVQGAEDQYGPLASLQPWYAALTEPKALRIVPACDHFFTGHQEDLAEALRGWLAAN